MVESNINADEEHKFSVSLLAFWVKGCIYSDQSFVHVDMPNTILFGMVPAGKNRKNIPVQSISNAQDSNWYKVGNMVFGVILALAGFYMMKETVLGGLLLTLIGIGLFLTGFKFRMSIERNSGVIDNFDVPFFEGDKVRKLVEEINQTVSSFEDQSNYRDYGRSNTQALINAMQQNQNGMMPNQQYQQGMQQPMNGMQQPMNGNMQQPMNNNMQQMPNQGMAQANPNQPMQQVMPNQNMTQDVQSEPEQPTNTDVESQPTETEQSTEVQPSQVTPNAAESVNSNQFCPKCGAQTTADARFCTNCGNQLQ